MRRDKENHGFSRDRINFLRCIKDAIPIRERNKDSWMTYKECKRIHLHLSALSKDEQIGLKLKFYKTIQVITNGYY